MGQWGKAKCLWEDPSSCQLPFLSFSPIIYFCQNVVELVIAWNGKSMGNQIRIGQRPIFGKRVLTSLARKMPKNVGHFAIHPRFPFSSPFSFTLGLLGAAGVFPVSFIPRFWLLASFFPWMGGRFCNARAWVVFLTFLELLVHFSIHVFVISCVFTMTVKSHSCFWLSHWLLGLTHWLFGTFFPAVSWSP